jgi:hypothetical protein
LKNEHENRSIPKEVDVIACKLSPAGLAAQSGRWHALADRALIERAETDTGLCLSFRANPGVEEELRALVLVENECCAWADWSVVTSPGQVALDVRSTGEGIAVLHGMFSADARA